MKLLKVIGLITLTSLASAHAAMTDAELTKEMLSDIKKYYVTIKSPKLIFHWADASDITPRGQYNTAFPSTSTQFKEYVTKQGKRVYNKRSENDRDIEGPGLYLASDPVISRSYGGTKSFGLIVGVVNTGARLLPGHYGGLPISTKIVAEINKRGCVMLDYLNIIDSTDAACTKVKQLLVGKDVTFAEGRLYQWGSSYDIEGCSDSTPDRDINTNGQDKTLFTSLDTFVGYSANLFTEVYGYTHKTGLSGSKLADEILSYLKGLQTLNSYNSLLSAEQMKDKKIKAMTKAEIKKFSQKHIFGCKP
jgi:hypothetical protein